MSLGIECQGRTRPLHTFSIVSVNCEAKMGVMYGDPWGPRMVARQRMMSLSSIGLALERVVSKSTSP